MADTSKYILPFESLNRWYDETLVPWLADIYPDYDPSGAAYILPESMSIIEFKILPAVALGLAIVAIVLTRRRRETTGLKVMVVAIGLLCYTYFELVLYRATGDTLMGSLGHEVAELWFLLITAEFLRRAFHPDRSA